jgi:hypothetical protein
MSQFDVHKINVQTLLYQDKIPFALHVAWNKFGRICMSTHIVKYPNGHPATDHWLSIGEKERPLFPNETRKWSAAESHKRRETEVWESGRLFNTQE